MYTADIDCNQLLVKDTSSMNYSELDKLGYLRTFDFKSFKFNLNIPDSQC